MFDLIVKGGVLMWPILACSVILVAVGIERVYCLKKARRGEKNLPSRARALVSSGKEGEALRLCENTPGAVAHVCGVALRLRSRDPKQKERLFHMARSRVLGGLEKNLSIISVIGNVAPLLGLLGTVTGMIKAFIKIQQMGPAADASVVAGGIWEALITTAAGLSVAIMAIILFHYLEAGINDIAGRMKDAGEALLDEEGVPVTLSYRGEGDG